MRKKIAHVAYNKNIKKMKKNEKMKKMADLVCKPGAKSIVWHYFGLKKDSDGSVVDNGNCVLSILSKNSHC